MNEICYVPEKFEYSWSGDKTFVVDYSTDRNWVVGQVVMIKEVQLFDDDEPSGVDSTGRWIKGVITHVCYTRANCVVFQYREIDRSDTRVSSIGEEGVD